MFKRIAQVLTGIMALTSAKIPRTVIISFEHDPWLDEYWMSSSVNHKRYKIDDMVVFAQTPRRMVHDLIRDAIVNDGRHSMVSTEEKLKWLLLVQFQVHSHDEILEVLDGIGYMLEDVVIESAERSVRVIKNEFGG